MTEKNTLKKHPQEQKTDYQYRIERARNFMCGYQFCIDMMQLRSYERKRDYTFDEECDCDDLLAGNEAFWRARMFGIKALLDSMKNGREKLILYYHYICGESIEHASNTLGISRRTGYRLHQKGLFAISFLMDKK